MPFHPAHRRIAPWPLVAVILLVGLLLALLIRSFAAGRERALDPLPATVPPAPGPLPTPVAPATPTPAEKDR
jgi:hypothetical protein